MPKAARATATVYHITTFWVKHPETGNEVTQQALHNALKSSGLFKRFAYQLEEGNAQHHQHYQIALHLHSKNRFDTVARACGYDNKQWFMKEMTFEGGGYSLAANAYKYATKEDTRVAGPWIEGDWQDAIDELAGKPKDKPKRDEEIEEIYQLVTKEGWLQHDFFIQRPLLLAHHGNIIDRYIKMQHILHPPEKLETPPYVAVFFGPPGTGKSSAAMQQLRDQGYTPYLFTNGHREDQKVFYTDYQPGVHDAIVYDDFYSGLPFSHLLAICHELPVRVNVHNGSIYIRPRAVVFTCNVSRGFPFKHYYDRWRTGDLGDGQDFGALMRRITEYKYFDDPVNFTCKIVEDPHIQPPYMPML